MIGGPAILPVMIVIGHQIGEHSVPAQDFRHGIVEGLHRALGPMQKVVPSSMQLPARGHTGQIACIAGIKLNGLPGELPEAGRKGFPAAVRGQHMTVQ